MGTKGVSHIKGVRSINTKPGPTTESKGMLKQYLLVAEKENLMRKLDWVRQQKDQTEKRIAEITRMMYSVQRAVEARASREPTSSTHSRSGGTFIHAYAKSILLDTPLQDDRGGK